MKAIAVAHFGDTPLLMDLPRPEVKPGCILIRIAAAAVNPYDWKLVDGIMKDHMPHVFPLIMGNDGAGVVEEVGAGVTRFKTGDKVYGQFLHKPVGEGAYAEYVVVPEKAAITIAPGNIPLEDAAAAPTAGMTAIQLVEAAELAAGQVLLIVGGTGGVGSFAIQVAASNGIHVIATVSSEEGATRVKALGAKETINYMEAPVDEQLKKLHPNGIDALIDTVNDKSKFEALSEQVKKGKVTLTTKFVTNDFFLKDQKLHGGNFETKSTVEEMEKLTSLLQQGTLKVPVESRIPLEEAPVAVAQSRMGKGKGKTVIVIN
ncbi:NADP-dependent oxidoreductase [Chitinophaga horti]|uniref:NADP-dependent oxidoreductase n=1 Tax=Chitinophaga horti TaxID=2920382 RepID=A0ABY6J686_9BACT|nr:NADP-dependent oxidoreductase [Chitinophaga horti]UYQ95127.1 NADP-dependent oxidoreductase [Chitinophaga horti]